MLAAAWNSRRYTDVYNKKLVLKKVQQGFESPGTETYLALIDVAIATCQENYSTF
jgi:hypothetical protein